jgi:hypothetical protein
MCVLLGSHVSVILWPLLGVDEFKVVGPSLCYGMMDGEALLGPLPENWIVEFYRDRLGYAAVHYRNKSTNVLTVEDPRLGVLPPEWERITRERTVNDPRWFSWFRNTTTGQMIIADPILCQIHWRPGI